VICAPGRPIHINNPFPITLPFSCPLCATKAEEPPTPAPSDDAGGRSTSRSPSRDNADFVYRRTQRAVDHLCVHIERRVHLGMSHELSDDLSREKRRGQRSPHSYFQNVNLAAN